jgi:hypothetical protein
MLVVGVIVVVVVAVVVDISGGSTTSRKSSAGTGGIFSRGFPSVAPADLAATAEYSIILCAGWLVAWCSVFSGPSFCCPHCFFGGVGRRK